MPTTVEIPLTTYSIRSAKPNQKYGSPAAIPLTLNASRILGSVSLDKVPADATITSAVLRVYSDRASAGSKNLRVQNITGTWNSSTVWGTGGGPAVGGVLDSEDIVAPVAGQPWNLDVTTWAQTRSRKGLRIESTSSPGHYVRGSSAAALKPVLIVTYTAVPATPRTLVPNAVDGVVSVAAPILTYTGEPGMTQQKIEFSNDGIAVSYTYGFAAATSGYYDPALDPGANPVLVDGGAGVYWRATTNGPDGQSLPSPWAYYEFVSLPVVAITNPGATATDGSPPLTWTVSTSQEAFKAEFVSNGSTVDSTLWRNEQPTRTWTPGKSIGVPGVVGTFNLEVQDQVPNRIEAVGAPTTVKVSQTFTTTLVGAGTAVDTLVYAYVEPIVTLTGTRLAGTPDEVMLVRDGVAVPLWDANGDVWSDWAPGASFFVGTAFTLPDYTAPPKTEHTWAVRTRTGGVTVSAEGPTVTATPYTPSVWLVDPRTGDTVDVCGYEANSVVEQNTEESAILHVPINNGLVVEPKRRRVIRTTRSGSLAGTVMAAYEDTLLGWVEDDSGLKYRLIFGKVNWPVILGDYSPSDVFYGSVCSPDRVLAALNWWQRLTDA